MPLEAHGEVDGAYVLGDAADGDVVDAGFGDFADGGGGDSAGSFEFEGLCGVGVHGYGFAHCLQREIVEHGDIGAGGDGLLQFGQILDFDLDRDSSGAALGGGYRGGDRTRGHDVIFLDEDSIEQAHAVVVTAADAHRVLLRGA